MKTLGAPAEPPIRTPSAQTRSRRTASRVAISDRAFKELVYDYAAGRCSYCNIGLKAPDEKAPEGDRPHFILRSPSSKDFPEGWLIACPCCAMENDTEFLKGALLDGKAAIFAWASAIDDHPTQIEISTTIRALSALFDRVGEAFPDQLIPNTRQLILQAFREEGYGIVPPWDGPEALTVDLRSQGYRLGLPELPPPGSRYIPNETRGKNATWMAHAWATILSVNPGCWERIRRHVVIIPWPDVAANSSFDLDAFTQSAVNDIERDEVRYRYAQSRIGEVQDVAARIKRIRHPH